MGVLKKTPEDKKMIYMIDAFIVMVAITFIISAILMAMFAGIIGDGMMGRGVFGM